jgi:hypothetical protein
MDEFVGWLIDIAPLPSLINAPQVQIDGTAHVLLVVVIFEARL